MHIYAYAYSCIVHVCAETEDVLAFLACTRRRWHHQRDRHGSADAGVRSPSATTAPGALGGDAGDWRRGQSEMKSKPSLYSQLPLTLASDSHNT